MRYLTKAEEGVYNRLFTKILDSSIWLEPSSTRIVWVTLLAAMDEDGFAHFSAIENLASRARVTVEEAQAAVDCFTAPDANSANTAHDGRRIERIPGGFYILNAIEHRKTFNREIRREQTRLRVAKHRAKNSSNKASVTEALRGVTPASDTASSFLEELKRNHLYAEVEFDRELEKAKQWCKRNNRRLTERFFTNWLNKADRVLLPQPKVQKPQPAKWAEFLATCYPDATEKDFYRVSDDVKREFNGWNEKV